MKNDKTVLVYIRRPGPSSGTNPEEGRQLRTITFRLPAGITQADVFKHGYAMDGEAAFKQIPRDELQATELELINWLTRAGYDVVFQ